MVYSICGDPNVKHIKRRIQDKYGIPSINQVLSYQGKKLCDETTVSQYGIEHGCIVDLSLPILGGTYKVYVFLLLIVIVHIVFAKNMSNVCGNS